MEDYYSFGIEIEITAIPRNSGSLLSTREHYKKFASALEARGLKVRVDTLTHRYRKHPEEYERGWWITKDGSIASSGSSSVEFEAVSPILYTSKDWDDTIDNFWKAQKDIFYMPTSTPSCGSHIHISSGSSRKWSTEQLKDIAVGIAYYENLVQEMLPSARRDNEYCRKNSASSSRLRAAQQDWNGLLNTVRGLDRAGLLSYMQSDRKVLWNFEPAGASGIGSIEFRGGRCLRGPNRTKWWIAFAVSYVHLLLKQAICTTGRFPSITSAEQLYREIRASAITLDLRRHLPLNHNIINELVSEARKLRNQARRQAGSQASRPQPSPAPPYSPPLEPPPVYSRQERSPTMSPPSQPTAGTDNTASRQRASPSDQEGTMSLTRTCYSILLALIVLFALLVLILNAVYLASCDGGTPSQANWAEFVAVISPLVALVKKGFSMRSKVITDAVMLLFWIIAFGTCHDKFIPDGSGVVQGVVWLALVNMLLWMSSLFFWIAYWCSMDSEERSCIWGRSNVQQGPAMSQV